MRKRPLRTFGDPLGPRDVGTAERVRGAVWRRVREHRDTRLSAAGAHPASTAASNAKAALFISSPWSAGSPRRARPCVSWFHSLASTMSADSAQRRDARAFERVLREQRARIATAGCRAGRAPPRRRCRSAWPRCTIQPFIHGGRCSTSFMEQTRLASACIGRSCNSRMYWGPANGMYIDHTKTAP